MDKPLFIPLKNRYFSAFKHGFKDTEYRIYGPRWNERVCYVGRKVVLSRGYGKWERLEGTIKGFQVVPGRTIKNWLDVFPKAIGKKAACITIALTTLGERG